MNLFAMGLLDTPLGLAASALVGVLFGFWLERAGFGSSRKLTAIFYFRDFAVLRVMFSAIAVAAVGLQACVSLGLADRAAIFAPDTVLWAQGVGGLIFGAGFVVGGWCPGTAAVGLASGKIDALVFLAGAGGGSLLFAAAWPAIEPLAGAGACGTLALPTVLGLSATTTTALVVAVALLGFAAAGPIERWVKHRATAGGAA
jgi:uncharacterized membrane protein YedE/YeeE